MTTLQQRFEDKYIPEPNSGCWLWLAYVNEDGYGRFRTSKEKMPLAHRASWEMHRGPIPDELQVLHHCDMPCCVNPDHLFLGTHSDNMKDRSDKGRIDLRGPGNPQAVLSEEQAAEIKASKDRGVDIAARYGITASLVCAIRNGRAWKHLP